jgi:RNA polymerase sigma factor (sigma-70 family)
MFAVARRRPQIGRTSHRREDKTRKKTVGFWRGRRFISEMQPHSDAQLLREYARQRLEAAFGELVARHADLVYSAALRQVDSPDVARDVAQTVFIDLARKARTLAEKLPPDASLVGWLYRSTRFATLNLVRGDQRRQARERQAMEQVETINPTPEAALDWERVRPLLDEAISSLDEEDRDALLLRFFKNQDFRAVGVALGVSDDAAQKRVSRALDKVRDLLSRKGITTTTAALSVAISANAVQTAPVGLVAAISTAATAATAVAPAALAATKIIAMTTMQKALIGATLAVAIGTGIHEARRASRLDGQLQSLQQEQAALADQVGQLTGERDNALGKLAASRQETERLRRDLQAAAQPRAGASGDPTEVAMNVWLKRIRLLKQRLEETPEARIPELQFLEDLDWVEVASKTELQTDTDYRKALAKLRDKGGSQFAGKLEGPLGKYMQAHNGEWPSDIFQLEAYFDPPVDRALLERWEIVPTTAFPGREFAGDWVITEKSAVDPEFDYRHTVNSSGGGGGPYHPYGYEEQPSKEEAERVALKAKLDPVIQAYRLANGGAEPRDGSRLQPYATTPEEQAALRRVIEMMKVPK